MSTQPKKILSLDGGGIRGLVTIEVLASIEQILRSHYRNDRLVLADYFDFIAGTSTGAIISAALAIGMSVDEVRHFYFTNGKEMFERASWLTRIGSLFGYKYHDKKLAQKLQEVFGKDTTLGSDKLKTLLMVVTHNVKTDSPWPVTNNPQAKYNDYNNKGCNLRIPLWQLVRASTAAPTYFPPEQIRIDNNDFVFVDGGITPYNDPAFQAFITATLNAYKINWPSGKDQLLLVSIGTGNHAINLPKLNTLTSSLFYHAATVPAHLMNSAQYQQDMLCRIFGDCRAGHEVDSEVGTLQGASGEGCVPEKLFTYLRYNFDISKAGLEHLGLEHLDPAQIRHLDAVDRMPQLQEVGRALARQEVQPEHFAGFLPTQPR